MLFTHKYDAHNMQAKQRPHQQSLMGSLFIASI